MLEELVGTSTAIEHAINGEELTFDDYEKLRKHQESKHKDFFEYHENEGKRGPAPGDVSIF